MLFVTMRMRSLVVILIVLVGVTSGTAQEGNRQSAIPVAKLLDEFGIVNSEMRSSRFDYLFQELFRSPGSVGYVLLYCGKTCRYGEIEAHIRGIELKTRFRNPDRTKLVVLHAGYRDSFQTELWLVPKGAGAPIARPSIRIQDVTFAERGKRFIEPYDCCDEISERVWKNVKW